MRDGAPEHRQLLTERQVFEGDRSVSTADPRKESEHDDERGQHELSCRAMTAESTGGLAIWFWRTTPVVVARCSAKSVCPMHLPFHRCHFDVGQSTGLALST